MDVVVKGVSKSFGRVLVLDGLDLAVSSGERVAVLGPSGCGKTTMLRLIAGLVAPDRGEVCLDGQTVSSRRNIVAPHKRGIGFAFQGSALWPHMTVRRNVAFGLNGQPRAEVDPTVDDLLEAVGLIGLADRYPDQLSGGEAHRVGLARALAPNPSLLLLDEPLTHLEPELRETLSAVISDHLSRTGATALYVTHNQAEATAVAATVLHMDGGRLNGGSQHDSQGWSRR